MDSDHQTHRVTMYQPELIPVQYLLFQFFSHSVTRRTIVENPEQARTCYTEIIRRSHSKLFTQLHINIPNYLTSATPYVIAYSICLNWRVKSDSAGAVKDGHKNNLLETSVSR